MRRTARPCLACCAASSFAKACRFDYRRPEPPEFARGGDAWLESTPPVLAAYQARAGQRFALALGVGRLRADSLAKQASLVGRLSDHGVVAVGGTPARGAFVVVPFMEAPDGYAAWVAGTLAARGIVADARGPFLRLCPDVLTSSGEVERAARDGASSVEAARA